MSRFAILRVIAPALVAGCGDLPTGRDTAVLIPARAFAVRTVECSASDLIGAINAANAAAGGTIGLDGDCTYALTTVDNYSADFGINGLPVVTSPITIDGNGATIQRDSGAPDFRIFYVLSAGDPAQALGRLTLNDVTISGGKFSNPGGGLVNNGGTVTINRSTISGNEAGDAGGGLSNLGGTLTLNHTTISRNEAADAGGGLSNVGGTVTLNHTTISGNETGDAGGGLSNVGGTVTLNHVTISGNGAGDAGGGLFNEGGTVKIINHSAISGNHTADNGGGVRNYRTGTLSIENSTISDNSADDDGGGVSNDGGTVVIDHGRITGNTAGDDGGGVANVAAGTLTIRNSTFSDNEAGETGGALYNYDATATVTGSTTSRNTAKFGGAIFSETVERGDPEQGATLVVHNSTISGNLAREAGGGLFNYKGSHLTVTHSTIAGNQSLIKGGGLLSYNDVDGRADVRATIIAGNTPDDVAAVEAKTPFNSLGYNLVGRAGAYVDFRIDFRATGDTRNVTSPGLGTLANNGGPTFTRALLSSSPALDRIPAPCTGQDQRGVLRPAGTKCDIGAFERSTSKVPQTIDFTRPPSPQSYGASFTVSPTASSGLAVSLVASGACTASGYDVTMIMGTGDCVLTASQGGDAANAAAPNVVRTVVAQKVELTVRADDEHIVVGGTPSFEVSYSGFVGLDNAGSLGGALVRTFQGTGSTTYAPTTTVPVAAGTYSITPSGLSSANYSFRYVVGTFTITGEIRFQSQNNAANGSTPGLSIGRPAGTRQGDFLLAQITFEKGSDAGSNTQITPSGWNLVRRTDRGTDLGQAIFYRVAMAAEPAAYTWTFPLALKAAGGILRYTGVHATPIVSSSGNTGDSITVTAGGVTAETRSVLVAFFGLKKSSTSLSAPSGMTARYYFESPLGLALEAADERRATAGGTGSRTSTAEHADKWVAQLVALRAK